MFRRIALWVVVFLAVGGAGAAYYFAPWFEAEWNIYQGRQAFGQGKFQTAIGKLTPIVDRPQVFSVACWDQKDCATYLRRMLAQSHLAEGQDEAAIAHYRKLPNDGRAHFVRGLVALKTSNWDESAEHFEHALKRENDCSVCRDALKAAQELRMGHASGTEARQVQAKALADTITPIKCLGFIGGFRALKYGTSAVLPPPLVAIIRKAGTTKRVADEVVNKLMLALRLHLNSLKDAITVCPPLSENETVKGMLETIKGMLESKIVKGMLESETVKGMLENDTVKWLRDLDALNFLRGDAESAAQAVLQAGALGEAIYRYGQGFNAERGSTQQAADADKRLAAHWEALVKASKKPAFIDSGIKDLKVAEAKQESGWFASTLDVLNPAKWLLK